MARFAGDKLSTTKALVPDQLTGRRSPVLIVELKFLIISPATPELKVHAVRNSTGKLTGVAMYSQADFDARTLIIRNQNGNVGVSGGTGNASPSVKP